MSNVHLRFDYALLSLFTYEQLAKPFIVTEKSQGDYHAWFVMGEDGACIGRVTKTDSGLYCADKVVFIPANREG